MHRSLAFKALLLLPLLFGACSAWIDPSAGMAAVNVASVIVFGGTVPDLVISGVSGRDCSVVRLEQGRNYCAEANAQPTAPPFCSRTLANVTCWANPADLTDHPRAIADGPSTLTPAQLANHTRRWPEF